MGPGGSPAGLPRDSAGGAGAGGARPAGRQDGLASGAGQDSQARHAQLQCAGDRADRHDLEHHGHHPVHRTELQEPLREEQPER